MRKHANYKNFDKYDANAAPNRIDAAEPTYPRTDGVGMMRTVKQ